MLLHGNSSRLELVGCAVTRIGGPVVPQHRDRSVVLGGRLGSNLGGIVNTRRRQLVLTLVVAVLALLAILAGLAVAHL